jgi:hypothetical protein
MMWPKGGTVSGRPSRFLGAEPVSSGDKGLKLFVFGGRTRATLRILV